MTDQGRARTRRAQIYFGGLIACVLAAACRSPSADQEARTASPASPPAFVGKTWMSTDPSAAPGTLRIFVPDGTLVMDSCGETYRLARWRAIDDRRVEWQENSARIEAEVTQVGSEQLQLRMQLGRDLKEEHYRLASVPFVCPDARPSQVMPSTDPARGVVTPAPTTYRCGNDTFKVAFEEQRAYVTMPDGSLVTLRRLNTGGDPEQPRTFSDGRMTFVRETEGTGAPRVLFARGRMVPAQCVAQR